MLLFDDLEILDHQLNAGALVVVDLRGEGDAQGDVLAFKRRA